MCPIGPLRVYVYDKSEIALAIPDGSTLNADKFSIFVEATDAVTRKSAEACIFVVGVVTPSIDYSRLPFWDIEKNHVIVDRGYSKCRSVHDIGLAMLYKTNLDTLMLRKGYDIPAPLHLDQHKCPSPKRPIAKESLLVFKGTAYAPPKGGWGRALFYSIRNNDGVIILFRCNVRDFALDRNDSAAPACAREREDFDSFDYDKLAARSTFCLAPAGRQTATYRLGESLSIGCIPVLTEDPTKLRSLLPYEGWNIGFQWHSAVVRYHSLEKATKSIVPDLRTISGEELALKRKYMAVAHEMFFGKCSFSSDQMFLHQAIFFGDDEQNFERERFA